MIWLPPTSSSVATFPLIHFAPASGPNFKPLDKPLFPALEGFLCLEHSPLRSSSTGFLLPYICATSSSESPFLTAYLPSFTTPAACPLHFITKEGKREELTEILASVSHTGLQKPHGHRNLNYSVHYPIALSPAQRLPIHFMPYWLIS